VKLLVEKNGTESPCGKPNARSRNCLEALPWHWASHNRETTVILILGKSQFSITVGRDRQFVARPGILHFPARLDDVAGFITHG
jgi:hypothetical protein